MPKITITLSDAHAARIADAFATAYGWAATVPNPAFDSKAPESVTNARTIPNPETKALHVERRVRDWLRTVTLDTEREAARKAVENPAPLDL